jgi:GH15 family glucan-1,4-alpha-glucosidase
MAQYYIRSGNQKRFHTIMDAVGGFINDLGFAAEEALVGEKLMAGNFPQAFVHSSLICAIIDYNNTLSSST